MILVLLVGVGGAIQNDSLNGEKRGQRTAEMAALESTTQKKASLLVPPLLLTRPRFCTSDK